MPREAVVLSVVVSVLLWSWPGGAEPAPSDAARDLTREASGGDVRVTVTASTARIRTSETLTLAVEVSCPDDVEVELPDAGAVAGDFAVVAVLDDGPRLVSGNRMCVRREWRLAPGLPGAHSTGAVRVVAAAVGAESVLTTEPLTISVQSVLPVGDERPDLRDIAPCVPIDAGRAPVWAGCIALVLLVAAVFVVARRRRGQAAPSESPRLIALDELRRLGQLTPGAGVPAELQGIACRFLADHYRLRSPMPTSDAVLERLVDAGVAAATLTRLRDFFAACDRARFGLRSDSAETVSSLVREFGECVDVCWGGASGTGRGTGRGTGTGSGEDVDAV